MRARFGSKFLISLAAAILVVFASFSINAERLPIKIYTSADGLGTSASFNLVRDARGFIWLCSRDGLVRFDGYRFTTYRIGDESADPAVFDLLPTKAGDYWINLNRGIDYRFSLTDDEIDVGPRPKGDVRVPFPAETVTGFPFPRFEDDDQNLWTANSDGLYLVKKEGESYSSELIRLELPGNPTGMLTIVEFRDARSEGYWVGTNWGVVRRLSDGRMFHTSIKPVGNSDEVRFFAEDDHERLWIAQPDGLVVLKTRPTATMADTKTNVRAGKLSADGMADLPDTPDEAVEFSFDDLLSGFSAQERKASDFTRPAVVSIFSGADGKVWITTNQGLITYDGTRFRHFTTKNGLATNDLSAITEGLDGSIWIASYGGLHRLNPTGMTSFDEFDGLELARIHAISEDSAGRLQTVSGNFNVSSFDGSKFEMARPQIPADEYFTWQSNVGLFDSRGDWWLHSNKNVHQFSNIRSVSELKGRIPNASYNETNGLVGGNVLKVFEDSGGNLWFSSYQSTEQQGLTRLDRLTKEFKSYQKTDGLPDGAAVATGFAEDQSNTLWFGFVEGRIMRYRDGKFSAVENENAPKGGITGMFGDSKGRIWIATNRDGLIQIENPLADELVFRRFTTADGLTSNNIRCITEDNFGNIYAGTVRGVNRLTPETGRVLYYGVADGLASDFVSSIFRDRHGDIWIGTFNGLSRLKPAQSGPTEPPRILISGLNISGEDFSVSPLGQAEVNVPDQSSEKGNIQIDFLSAGSSFSAPVRYQHRFDGDNDWSAASSESSVTFANLAAGSYRFFVRAVNPDGIASATPAAVNFTILRPVWQRWWFLLLAAVALATLIYLIYRYRVAQLLKLERVRTRIASDLHDDIGSSLSQIAILSEVARQKSGDNGAAEPLKLIAETSREMVDSMSDIVWAINPLKDKLGDLIQRMRRFAEDSLDAKDIGYRFDLPESLRDVSLGADVRREVYLIFKECINNLVKHSGASRAIIKVNLEGDNLLIEVSDNGCGFDISKSSSDELESYGGNGLPNMRKRAQSLGGVFAVESDPANGTNVVLRIPIIKKWISTTAIGKS